VTDARMPLVAGLGALSIIGLVVAIYGGTLAYPFEFDDQLNITQNPGIRVGVDRSWGELRLWSPTRRPVSNASFAVSFALGGYAVEGYRALNIALHAWTSLLVGLLAWLVLGRAAELTGVEGGEGLPDRRVWLSLFSGLLFAAHPLATQPVVYVVQRMTVLSTLFYVGGLCTWIVGGRVSGVGGSLLRVSSLVLGVLSLGSKEIGATFPLALWLWEWGFVRDGEVGYLRRSVPWLLGVFGVGLLLLWAYSGGDPLRGYGEKAFTLWERCWTEPRVWWRYVGLVLAPLPGRLSLIHEVEMSSGPWRPWTTWVSWSSWGLLLWLSCRGWSRHRWWSALVVWWLLQQVVEGTVLPLEPMYEHRTYLPLVGWSVLVPWGAWRCLEHASWSRRFPGAERALLAVGVGLVLLLGWGAQARSRVWQDPLTLWTDAHDKAPGHPRPLVNLGMAIAARGDPEKAIVLYDEAERIEPGFQEAHHDRGVALQSLGRHEEAIVDFTEALRLQPRDALAHEAIADSFVAVGELDRAAEHLERAVRLGSDLRVPFKLARLRAAAGRLEEAEHWLRVVTASAPDHPAARAELGIVLARRGHLGSGIEQVDRSLAVRDDAAIQIVRARMDWAAGRWASAIERARAARARAPNAAAARTTLGWMLVAAPDTALRDTAEALAVIRQGTLGASEINGLEVLAALEAEAGRVVEAERLARSAAAQARRRGAIAYAEALETQALRYARGERAYESKSSAHDRLTKGGWVRLPPRGSPQAPPATGNSAS
jgi:Flp pilus assembly protein TadD